MKPPPNNGYGMSARPSPADSVASYPFVGGADILAQAQESVAQEQKGHARLAARPEYGQRAHSSFADGSLPVTMQPSAGGGQYGMQSGGPYGHQYGIQPCLHQGFPDQQAGIAGQQPGLVNSGGIQPTFVTGQPGFVGRHPGNPRSFGGGYDGSMESSVAWGSSTHNANMQGQHPNDMHGYNPTMQAYPSSSSTKANTGLPNSGYSNHSIQVRSYQMQGSYNPMQPYDSRMQNGQMHNGNIRNLDMQTVPRPGLDDRPREKLEDFTFWERREYEKQQRKFMSKKEILKRQKTYNYKDVPKHVALLAPDPEGKRSTDDKKFVASLVASGVSKEEAERKLGEHKRTLLRYTLWRSPSCPKEEIIKPVYVPENTKKGNDVKYASGVVTRSDKDYTESIKKRADEMFGKDTTDKEREHALMKDDNPLARIDEETVTSSPQKKAEALQAELVLKSPLDTSVSAAYLKPTGLDKSGLPEQKVDRNMPLINTTEKYGHLNTDPHINYANMKPPPDPLDQVYDLDSSEYSKHSPDIHHKRMNSSSPGMATPQVHGQGVMQYSHFDGFSHAPDNIDTELRRKSESPSKQLDNGLARQGSTMSVPDSDGWVATGIMVGAERTKKPKQKNAYEQRLGGTSPGSSEAAISEASDDEEWMKQDNKSMDKFMEKNILNRIDDMKKETTGVDMRDVRRREREAWYTTVDIILGDINPMRWLKKKKNQEEDVQVVQLKNPNVLRRVDYLAPIMCCCRRWMFGMYVLIGAIVCFWYPFYEARPLTPFAWTPAKCKVWRYHDICNACTEDLKCSAGKNNFTDGCRFDVLIKFDDGDTEEYAQAPWVPEWTWDKAAGQFRLEPDAFVNCPYGRYTTGRSWPRSQINRLDTCCSYFSGDAFCDMWGREEGSWPCRIYPETMRKMALLSDEPWEARDWKFGENQTEFWYAAFGLLAFAGCLFRCWKVLEYGEEIDAFLTQTKYFLLHCPSETRKKIRRQRKRTRRAMRKILNEPPNPEDESSEDENKPKPRASKEVIFDRTVKKQEARFEAQRQRKIAEQKFKEEEEEREAESERWRRIGGRGVTDWGLSPSGRVLPLLSPKRFIGRAAASVKSAIERRSPPKRRGPSGELPSAIGISPTSETSARYHPDTEEDFALGDGSLRLPLGRNSNRSVAINPTVGYRPDTREKTIERDRPFTSVRMETSTEFREGEHLSPSSLKDFRSGMLGLSRIFSPKKLSLNVISSPVKKQDGKSPASIIRGYFGRTIGKKLNGYSLSSNSPIGGATGQPRMMGNPRGFGQPKPGNPGYDPAYGGTITHNQHVQRPDTDDFSPVQRADRGRNVKPGPGYQHGAQHNDSQEISFEEFAGSLSEPPAGFREANTRKVVPSKKKSVPGTLEAALSPKVRKQKKLPAATMEKIRDAFIKPAPRKTASGSKDRITIGNKVDPWEQNYVIDNFKDPKELQKKIRRTTRVDQVTNRRFTDPVIFKSQTSKKIASTYLDTVSDWHEDSQSAAQFGMTTMSSVDTMQGNALDKAMDGRSIGRSAFSRALDNSMPDQTIDESKDTIGGTKDTIGRTTLTAGLSDGPEDADDRKRRAHTSLEKAVQEARDKTYAFDFDVIMGNISLEPEIWDNAVIEKQEMKSPPQNSGKAIHNARDFKETRSRLKRSTDLSASEVTINGVRNFSTDAGEPKKRPKKKRTWGERAIGKGADATGESNAEPAQAADSFSATTHSGPIQEGSTKSIPGLSKCNGNYVSRPSSVQEKTVSLYGRVDVKKTNGQVDIDDLLEKGEYWHDPSRRPKVEHTAPIIALPGKCRFPTPATQIASVKRSKGSWR